MLQYQTILHLVQMDVGYRYGLPRWGDFLDQSTQDGEFRYAAMRSCLYYVEGQRIAFRYQQLYLPVIVWES